MEGGGSRGSDIQSRNERQGQQSNWETPKRSSKRTIVHKRLPSQPGVRLVNNLPNVIKIVGMPKAFKTLPKIALISGAFYGTGEFIAHNYWDS